VVELVGIGKIRVVVGRFRAWIAAAGDSTNRPQTSNKPPNHNRTDQTSGAKSRPISLHPLKIGPPLLDLYNHPTLSKDVGRSTGPKTGSLQ